MRVLLQRVRHGRVMVGERNLAEIGTGMVILVGVGPGDGEQQARYLAEKVANLRIFEDEAGKLVCISRLTLAVLDVSNEMK